MNRISDYEVLKQNIVDWLLVYARQHDITSLVVGVSGGVDSATVSTLAAETGLSVFVVNMPIHQRPNQEQLSSDHIDWLMSRYSNVTGVKVDLTTPFDVFRDSMGEYGVDELGLANSRSRLRMVALYQIAASVGGLVVGTGNKVEDYGIGFYTKYGDGGVDIAPIADLYKTEVRELARHMGVSEFIVTAAPTDGLWDDARTDEDQIGTTYEMLEWVMETDATGNLTVEQQRACDIYTKFQAQNKHKMLPIPTFKVGRDNG